MGEGGKRTFGWEYTKYNKINSNSKNFGGAKLLLGKTLPLGPL